MKNLLLAAATMLALSAGVATAQPVQMTLAGASPGGLWSLVGVGVDKAVKAAYPGSTVTYQTSGGGFANVALLDSGRAEIGVAHTAEVRLALQGKEPYKKQITSMRAIAYLYNWSPMFVVVNKKFADQHGLKTFEDIITKKAPIKIVFNRRGNVAEYVAQQMFRAAGAEISDLEKWGGRAIFAASEEQSDLMKDGRVDAMINSLFLPHRSVSEAAQSVELVMLPVSKKVIDKVAADEGLEAWIIPAKTFDFQTQDVPTLTLGAGLFATEKLSEKAAYDLTKALVEHVGELKSVHKSMEPLTPQLMASQTVVPYHPGAAKYYKEKGLLK
jgi:TRAP transporter TAXI family solute receptor